MRIKDKIREIENYLKELNTILPLSLEEYKNIEKKAACERYVEKIVEGFTDLAFYTIKMKNLRLPDDDADAFNILSEKNIIDEALANKLKQAKGMRNIIAHQYGQIDDEVVFEAVSNRLEKDTTEFLQKIKELI